MANVTKLPTPDEVRVHTGMRISSEIITELNRLAEDYGKDLTLTSLLICVARFHSWTAFGKVMPPTIEAQIANNISVVLAESADAFLKDVEVMQKRVEKSKPNG